ncbi:UvrD-helicase domain-containing protein [Nonomuraea jiangxiensis]|uniref:UvrD-like helicase C-terminal domain-containing protein n=1 Tax=Nonomuraea jiangxiensis TaxID=633440 RepID=A0A1G8NFH9_9ACTN|nr:UvrD-helicase domain-containing protein [Nonomuraea jiangxiensis]SDI78882.1 UvrD-like helicase C-terminal domain-containing protein [Nonomuraea jiangxiensis]
MPRLAIGPEFPRELSALAQPVRRDAVVALRRFLLNVAGAPHPERVRGARDPRAATLRLAEGHRGVVVRHRDVYWLRTILPDPEAWSYARRHRYGVNPATGVVEVWDAEALERVEPALRRSVRSPGLFDPICDGDLLALGLDVHALPLFRLITTEADVAALEPLLPPTQHVPLAVLARGGSLAEAWRELDAWRATPEAGTGSAGDPGRGPVDTEDLHAALLRSPDRAAFVADKLELDRVLAAPAWCTFPYPPQHRLARGARYEQPALVVGGAGTGKTVIALHRAAYLAAHGSGPVLLVTFSQGLAEELATRLDVLIDDEVVRKRVEVDNPERLVMRIVTDAEGRRPSLVGPGARSLAELTDEATRLLSRATGDLLDDVEPGRKPYRHIIVDEAQDVSPAQWRLLRAAAPHAHDDLFVVGDPHQRVTDTRVVLGAVGIPAAQHTLSLSYRLPQELLSFVVRLRGGGPTSGLVKGMTAMYGLRAERNGERPVVRAYDTFEAELAGLRATIESWLADGVAAEEMAVGARNPRLVRDAKQALDGLEVRTATFSHLKGLEFERVALIGVTEGVVPEPPPADPDARARALQRERSILFVACTRARTMLYISHSGRGSPFLPL